MKAKTRLEINYLKIAREFIDENSGGPPRVAAKRQHKNARVGRETLGSLGYDRPIRGLAIYIETVAR
jgi:hypothetical protein